MNVFSRHVKMAELDLTLRPCQLKAARDAVEIVILVGQRQGLLARLGNGRGERDADGSPGRDPDLPPQAKDRVENGTARSGKAHAPVQRRGIGRCPAAAEKTGPVRLILHGSDSWAIDGDDVNGP